MIALAAGVGRAQPNVPESAFVRDVGGTVWLVHQGRRVQVPIYPATDDEVDAIPIDGQWLVPQDGKLVLGSRPAWLDADREGEARQGSGETASLDGLSVTILQVSRGWLPTLASLRPKPGMEFLTIEVRLRNSGGRAMRYSPYDFHVDVEDGSRWDRTWGRSPDLLVGAVAAGATAEGWLTFEVPIGRQAVQLVWFARRDYALAISL
jgi:hypothetical protein